MLIAALVLAIAAVGLWSCLALWYRLPAPPPWRAAAAGLFALLALATIGGLFSRLRAGLLAAFAVAFLAVAGWWASLEPPRDGDWAPDVAHQVTGRIDGDRLTLAGVRNFDWTSETAFTPRWETRSYDLADLTTLDLFMSYWAGPEMAHVLLSFGFTDGSQLVWSVEVRRRNGGEFSPVADLFKSNPLVIIAADERDIVALRTNFRGEDVQLYRLAIPPTAARKLLIQYVDDANALAEQPRFYNSLSSNCTTTVVKMARAAGDPLPADWRLIVNGYLPEYLYAQRTLDIRLPLAELRAASHISARAKAIGVADDFSARIRDGVPAPIAAAPTALK